MILSRMKDFPTAMDVLDKAIAEQPSVAEFYLYKALIYEEQKQYELRRWMSSRRLWNSLRDNTEMLFRHAIILDKMDNKTDALAVSRKILGLDPDNVNALNYIGYSYADSGIRLGEAKQLIEKALKLKPNDGYITDSLAWVYFKMHQYHKALELMLKAVEPGAQRSGDAGAPGGCATRVWETAIKPGRPIRRHSNSTTNSPKRSMKKSGIWTDPPVAVHKMHTTMKTPFVSTLPVACSDCLVFYWAH